MRPYFYMNGYLWKVIFVEPSNPMLMDRTGTQTVATTDPNTFTVYLSNALNGSFATRVLIHELGHCALFSFDLIKDIRRMVKPEYWIEAEEWVSNFIADYGRLIFSTAYHIMGDDAWMFIPRELEKIITCAN